MKSIKVICSFIGTGQLYQGKREARKMKRKFPRHAFPSLVLIYIGFAEGQLSYQELQFQLIELLKTADCLDQDSYRFMNSIIDELGIGNAGFLLEMFSLLVTRFPQYKVAHLKLAYLFFNDYKKDEQMKVLRNYILRYQDRRNSFQIPLALYLNALLETENFSTNSSSSLDELLSILERDFFPFLQKLQHNELYICILSFYKAGQMENCLAAIRTMKLRYSADFKSNKLHILEIKCLMKMRRHHEAFIGALGCILTVPEDPIYFKLSLKSLKGVLELSEDDYVKLRKKMLTSLTSVLGMKRLAFKVGDTLCCGCVDFVLFIVKNRLSRDTSLDLQEYKCVGYAALNILGENFNSRPFYLCLSISKCLTIDPDMMPLLNPGVDLYVKLLCSVTNADTCNILRDLNSLPSEVCSRSEKALYTISIILKDVSINDKYLTILCYLNEWKRTQNLDVNYEGFMNEEGSSRIVFAEAICHAHIGSYERAFQLTQVSKMSGLLKVMNGYPIYVRCYFACSDEWLDQIFEMVDELQVSSGYMIFDQIEDYLCTFERKIEDFIKIIKNAYQSNNDLFSRMISLEYFMRLFLKGHYQTFFKTFSRVSKCFERKFCDHRGKELVDVFYKRKSRKKRRCSFELESLWVKYNFQALKLASFLVVTDGSIKPTKECFEENASSVKCKMDEMWSLMGNIDYKLADESFELPTCGMYRIWAVLGLNEIFTKMLCVNDHDSVVNMLQQLKTNVVSEINKIDLIDAGTKYREFCLFKSTINRTAKFLKNYYSCLSSFCAEWDDQKQTVHSMLDEISETALDCLGKLKCASMSDFKTEVAKYLQELDSEKIEEYTKSILEKCGDQVKLF